MPETRAQQQQREAEEAAAAGAGTSASSTAPPPQTADVATLLTLVNDLLQQQQQQQALVQRLLDANQSAAAAVQAGGFPPKNAPSLTWVPSWTSKKAIKDFVYKFKHAANTHAKSDCFNNEDERMAYLSDAIFRAVEKDKEVAADALRYHKAGKKGEEILDALESEYSHFFMAEKSKVRAKIKSFERQKGEKLKQMLARMQALRQEADQASINLDDGDFLDLLQQGLHRTESDAAYLGAMSKALVTDPNNLTHAQVFEQV